MPFRLGAIVYEPKPYLYPNLTEDLTPNLNKRLNFLGDNYVQQNHGPQGEMALK